MNLVYFWEVGAAAIYNTIYKLLKFQDLKNGYYSNVLVAEVLNLLKTWKRQQAKTNAHQRRKTVTISRKREGQKVQDHLDMVIWQ